VDAALALLRRIVGVDRVLAEPDAAREIVELCGGLPLAVRIAGARLAARERWSLAHLAGRLRRERRRLDELSVGDLTVRASLAMSYRTLQSPAGRAFRLLGLLDVPDFPAWACAALLGIATDEAEARLEALMDAQLLVCVGTDARGDFRYRYHDLVRLYARERAEEEDGSPQCAAAVGRALGAWLALAETADRGLPERVAADIDGPAPRRGPTAAIAPISTAGCLAWFDSERAALSACVAQACAAGFADLAWELAARSVGYYAFRGLYEDWSHTHDLALKACLRAGDRLGEAVMVRNLSCLRMTGVKVGNGTVPVRLAAALRTFRESGRRHGEVDMLGMLGFSLRGTGSPGDVLALADAAMGKAERIGYELGQCRLWYLRAVAHREQGRYADAVRCAERCLDMASDAGTAHDRVLALWEMAAAGQDHTASAGTSDRVLEGLELCRRRGERLLEAYLLVSLAELRLRAGDLAPARAHGEAALAVFDEHAVLFGRGAAHRLLGRLDHAAGHPARAVSHLIRAERAFRRLHNAHEQAMTLKVMAESMYANGQDGAAERAGRRARTLLLRLGNDTEATAVGELRTP
ncbi:tetratricopeptide repeat protein, partial [Actinomadura sp. HBU206391]|uniref:tetratricopeptide repeat protein n=1 Tax=Actinomadura sp. HBU206391 TaxID=2731692 RepID=UPI0016508DB3